MSTLINKAVGKSFESHGATLGSTNKFPSLNSQRGGIALNADGSVDIYFGPEAPAGRENNWVQTAPGKAFFLLLHLYGPLDPWFDKTWRPGKIEIFN